MLATGNKIHVTIYTAYNFFQAAAMIHTHARTHSLKSTLLTIKIPPMTLLVIMLSLILMTKLIHMMSWVM